MICVIQGCLSLVESSGLGCIVAQSRDRSGLCWEMGPALPAGPASILSRGEGPEAGTAGKTLKPHPGDLNPNSAQGSLPDVCD